MFNELYEKLLSRYKKYKTQFKLSDSDDTYALGHAHELSWMLIELYGSEKAVPDMERFERILEEEVEENKECYKYV